jgi:phage major head subunit gpT-like protein
MSNNLNLEQGLLNANTAWISNWGDVYATAVAGPYQAWTETVDAQDAARLDINFIANHPVMAKWQGPRPMSNMRHYNLTLSYDVYAVTLPLKRTLIANDRTGAVERAIQTFQQAQLGAHDKAVATLFDSATGASGTGFDGVALFSTAHPHGPSGNQSNFASGTNLSHAALRAAEYAGMLLQYENGEPAKVRYNMIRVGPKLKRRAQELLSADRLQTAAADSTMDVASSGIAAATRSNVYAGELDVSVDDRVTNFYWTLADGNKSAKPMLVFNKRNIEAISRTDMTDPHRFNYDEFLFGLEGDWGVTPGHWLTCYRGTGTA